MLRKFFLFFRMEGTLFVQNGEAALSSFFFVFLVLILFSISSLFKGGVTHQQATPLIWLAVLFGGILRMNQTFESEKAGEIISLIRMEEGASVPFFLAKLFFNFLFILALELFSLIFVILFFNLPDVARHVSHAFYPCLLGAGGFAILGTTFSGMVASHHRRDLILPIISYPLLMPVIAGVIMGISYSSEGEAMALNSFWLKLMGVADLVYLVLSLLVVDFLME